MNLNKSLIKKIENIIQLSKDFDIIFKYLLSIDNRDTDCDKIKKVYELTSKYIFIRSEHGSLIIILDNIKKIVNDSNTELSDELINKLYNISASYSMIQEISQLISNIDFQFKQIALLYPKYICTENIAIILVINTTDKDNKYINIINRLKDSNPENTYKIIHFDNNKSNILKLDIFDRNITLKIKDNPSLFLINNNNITEIPITKINNFKSLQKMIM